MPEERNILTRLKGFIPTSRDYSAAGLGITIEKHGGAQRNNNNIAINSVIFVVSV